MEERLEALINRGDAVLAQARAELGADSPVYHELAHVLCLAFGLAETAIDAK
jgi:hypothetical protein